jgi:dihydrofolate reductase
MRRVILFNLMSLDGYFEGPSRDINWHSVDDEFNVFAIEQLNEAEALIFGRVTYEMMASFWPSEFALETDPIVAGKMNSLPKYVFSHTLASADWNNTTLIKGDAADELMKLKEQPGKDLFVFGSAVLASTFLQRGLIDELRVLVNPLLLGNGSPLFPRINGPVKLRLLRTRTFGNGNVLLTYAPEQLSL